MYKITWDKETGGVLLHTHIVEGTLGISPRPVFYEELDLIGLDKAGWTYPRVQEPIMWAVNKQYWYRGTHLFDAKGADIYHSPVIVLAVGIAPMDLQPIDVQKMIEKNADLMFHLESEAIEFIQDTYRQYAGTRKVVDTAPANALDYEQLAQREEKRSGQKMAIVKQDCDSFDIMPLDKACSAGKRIYQTTRIDKFIASFSGGKDSQVVLDLCTHAIPPAEFEVIYSDTGYELPSSLELYKETESYYTGKFPALKFSVARNHETVLHYWDTIGTPSDTHRWCCSVMKTAPLYRKLRVGGGGNPYKTLTFDGVRAEESVRRENYQRIGLGKHTFVFNAHPILFWNAVEIFLYIFANNLLINPAYRVGKARVGCIICPFSSSWDDMIIQKQYPQELQPFTDRLQRFSSQVKIQDFERYIAERKWKLKPLAERTQPIPRVSFKTSLSDLDFLAEIIDAKNSLLDWLPAVCDFTIKQTKNGNEGELNYKKQVYPFFIEQNDNVTNLKVEGKLPNDFLFLLRRLVFKTAFCVHCEVCEVDCPTGALTIVPSINIDNSKCTHCHKCFNSHDRGCIAADCSRMITDSEKKLNAKVQGYKKFGLREIWIDEYSVNPVEFWKDNTLGTAQEDSLKAWLRDAEVIDKKNNLTEIGELMMNLYKETPSLFWEIAFINLSYNSFIVKWFTNNIVPNQIYNSKIIIEEISNQSYTGSLATVGNAALAFVDMVKKSPIGDDFVQGVEQGKDGLQREEYNDLSIEAVAYSIYRLAITHGVTMLRVADLYNKNEEYGPYKEFMISKQALLKKLRTISSSNNRVLTAELTMGLDHITLRQDLNHIEALKEMTK